MYAVILAAGRGTRMGVATETCPKPMLEINGKPKLAYSVEQLPDEITDVVIVVGYLQEQIRDFFGSMHAGKSIHYVEQTILDGSGGAVQSCKTFLKNQDNFLVINGDDLYVKKDLERMLRYPYALLAYYSYAAKDFGLVGVDEEDNFESIIEKSDKHSEGLVNAGAYMIGQEFFDVEPVWSPNQKEQWLPHTILTMNKDQNIRVVHATNWFPIGNPEQLELAQIEIAKFE